MDQAVGMIQQHAAWFLERSRRVRGQGNKVKRHELRVSNEPELGLTALHHEFPDGAVVRADWPNAGAWMNALAEKTDVSKMTAEELVELVEVEFLHMKWIRFRRYVLICDFVWSRHDKHAIRLKQPFDLAQKFFLFLDVLDSFEADNDIERVILADWDGCDGADNELESFAAIPLGGVTDGVFVNIHAHYG